MKKVKKAKTDEGPKEPNVSKPEYIENLFTLLKLVSPKEALQHYEEAYQNCTIRYGDLKKQLAQDLIGFMAPIRDRAIEIQSNTNYLEKIIRQGSEKARQSASETMKEVKRLMGLQYF